MATTVVDKLIVEFGLDPRQFKAGLKEANLAIVSTKDNTNKGANEMVQSLRRVAAEFVSLFLAIRSIKDVAGVFSEINESTRQLGFQSRNTDESAAALKDWGNIAEIVGGKAEDAQSTLMGLQKAIFDVGHGLGWSPQLTEFGRIGVDTGVGQGKVRNAHDLLRETTIALESQFKDPAARFQETQVLGIQGGLANLVAGGVKEFDRQWAQQQGIPQVSKNDTAQAQRLTESWDVLKQRIEAELRQILTTISPALQKVFKGLGDWIKQHQGEFTAGIQNLLGWFSGPGPQQVIDSLTAIGEAAANVAKFLLGIGHPTGWVASVFGDKNFFSGEQTKAEKAAGLPIGTLSRQGLDSPSRNKTSLSDTAAEIAQWHLDLGGDKQDPNYDQAVQAFMDQHQIAPLPKGLLDQQADWYKTHTWYGSPIDDAGKANAGAGSSPKARALAGGKPTAFNESSPGGGSTSVRIDELNVYSAAKDATGIAGDLDSALQRKLTVSLADGALS